MKPGVTYEVLNKFDRSKDYTIYIQPRVRRALTLLRKDQKLTVSQFIQESDLGRLYYTSKQALVYRAFSIGRRIGMLKVTRPDIHLLFEEFTNLESVSSFFVYSIFLVYFL